LGLLTKERLKSLLLTLEPSMDEDSVITAWTTLWKDYFKVASAESEESNPSNVSIDGDYLRIGVNSILGPSDLSGSSVVVSCSLTGKADNLSSDFDTENFIMTNDYLGQSSPSINIDDYLVSFPNMLIIQTNLSDLENMMANALSGIIQPDAGAGKLKAGIQAWWQGMANVPSNFFANATEVIAPSKLSDLSEDLQEVFDENVSANPPLTADEAVEKVAEIINIDNLGGIIKINDLVFEVV